jgi:hypothetical protein
MGSAGTVISNLPKEVKKLKKALNKAKKGKNKKDDAAPAGGDSGNIVELDEGAIEEICMVELEEGGDTPFPGGSTNAVEGIEAQLEMLAAAECSDSEEMQRAELDAAQRETHRLSLEVELVKQRLLKTTKDQDADEMANQLLAYQQMLGKMAEQIDERKAKAKENSPPPARTPVPAPTSAPAPAPWYADTEAILAQIEAHNLKQQDDHWKQMAAKGISRPVDAPAPAPVPVQEDVCQWHRVGRSCMCVHKTHEDPDDMRAIHPTVARALIKKEEDATKKKQNEQPLDIELFDGDPTTEDVCFVARGNGAHYVTDSLSRAGFRYKQEPPDRICWQ